MEIKILNSILYNELIPWLFDTKDIKAINEKIKKISNKEPSTQSELTQQIQILIADYPELSKWLNQQPLQNDYVLINHSFNINFSDYHDPITKYYNLIIKLETLRIYNAFNSKINQYNSKVDIVYHTTIALKNVKAITIATARAIKERGFEETPTEQSSLAHFVLYLLRQYLIILFFDIQELSKTSLDSITTIEDFYLLDLGLPKAQMNELVKIDIEIERVERILTPEKLTFGFKGDGAKLKSVISQLVNQLELLNENECTSEHLFTVLTSKSLTNQMHKIYFGCETVQLSYIIEKLGFHFTNLTPTSIAKSALFYTKNNKLLTAQNLYSNKIDNPKNQPIIDNIIKQLQ